MASIKESAITYIRSDIDTLRDQSEEQEIRAFVNRIRGEIGLLMTTKVITIDEAQSLEEEMGQARKQAAQKLEV
ncbi:hypothetical protein [Photobacterium minamisatsumaniensis]|uniref:hypothetical protein n=1 Tax=Photobacterium minamisatsumaniensis TaxID=2910233 RepID=UPI003D120FE9